MITKSTDIQILKGISAKYPNLVIMVSAHGIGYQATLVDREDEVLLRNSAMTVADKMIPSPSSYEGEMNPCYFFQNGSVNNYASPV